MNKLKKNLESFFSGSNVAAEQARSIRLSNYSDEKFYTNTEELLLPLLGNINEPLEDVSIFGRTGSVKSSLLHTLQRETNGQEEEEEVEHRQPKNDVHKIAGESQRRSENAIQEIDFACVEKNTIGMKAHISSSMGIRESQIQGEPDVIFNQNIWRWFELSKEIIGVSLNSDIHVYKAFYFPTNATKSYTLTTETKNIPTCVKLIRNSDLELMKKMEVEIKKNIEVPYHYHILSISHTLNYEGNTYVVFRFMDLGSIRSLMDSHFRDGLPERYIVMILGKTLRALCAIHESSCVHREVNAGHIFMNGTDIELGFSATVYDELKFLNESSSSLYQPRVSICTWAAAPEVYNFPNNEYTPECDIWLIGITALELAYGNGLRIRNREELDSMLMTIREKNMLPTRTKTETTVDPIPLVKNLFSLKGIFGQGLPDGKRKFSKKFGEMVAKCLAVKPSARPSAAHLLKEKIILNSKVLEVYHFFHLVNKT